MTMPRRIGILGGMGPAATILLMQRVLASVEAEDDSGHIPLLVDNNTQVPSRIDRLIQGRGPDPEPELVRMARGLEAAGAEALAMPCNTAHHYAAAIRVAVGVPFIDMVALSCRAARRAAGGGARIGILGSPALRRIGLYDAALAREGLSAIHPADETSLLDAIRAIKARGADAGPASAVAAAAREMRDSGASLCLVACTEFSVVADRLSAGVPLIDTLDVLVDAIHDFALSPATPAPAKEPVYDG